MFRRKFQARRRMTREEKAAEELEWRRINEEIELSAEGVEPLLGAYSGYSVEVTAMLIFPFLNMFMMWFPMVRRGVRASTLGRRRRRDADVVVMITRESTRLVDVHPCHTGDRGRWFKRRREDFGESDEDGVFEP